MKGYNGASNFEIGRNSEKNFPKKLVLKFPHSVVYLVCEKSLIIFVFETIFLFICMSTEKNLHSEF